MTTTETPTRHTPAARMTAGSVVMGFGPAPDRTVATVTVDRWGVWVTYTDGVRDSFPVGYRVVTVG